MLVSEILRIKGHTLFTTPPERSVLEAVEVMAQHDIGSLVVMDHGHLAGMLTFAEVLQALAERRGSLGDAAVADIYRARVRSPRHPASTSWSCGGRCSSATRATFR